MKVFLDIDIGDAAKYEQQLAAYNRAVAFLQQCGSQYGLSSKLADLDDEGLQMLRDAYDSDPNWSSKGGLRTQPLPRSCSSEFVQAAWFVALPAFTAPGDDKLRCCDVQTLTVLATVQAAHLHHKRH